ncbi:Methionyl-tRNA formyltransferase [Campylobacter majalis]|uniref:phosphoribosylglycinamide formyltransferase 1 n=1 Tax=Campylobacter majalis TaxID=2790656 RepID=A0ABN7KCN6_9BACT|nr:formyltransferase family protein [Campylobacter majalis]CAD7289829.1 Methionyl-tRNA formyltransferase [Campylobacter majalis]
MKFDKIYLIGSGRVAKKCLEIASDFFDKQVVHLEFHSKTKADEFFKNLKNSLIISANNFYIFKPPTTTNNTIINYHNSLLPSHAGMNAHVWAIFQGDKQSGVTWHFADDGIDTGRIIAQEKIEILPDMTAAELLIKQQNLAVQIFKDCLKRLKNNNFILPSKYKPSYHKKGDLPNDGIIDVNTMSKEQILVLLRAMDVGAFRQIAYPKIFTNNKWQDIVFYETKQDCIELFLQDKTKLIIKY